MIICFYSLQKLSIGGNPWNCVCLDELITVLIEKGISFEHFDGNRPACVTNNNIEQLSVCKEGNAINLENLEDFYKNL